MATHRVFIYTPSRVNSAIREAEAEIEVKEKCTWAHVKGKHHLLGSTAFYTLAAANRAKRGALMKAIATPYLRRMMPSAVYWAESQLAHYEAKGEFPLTRRLH